MPDLRKNIFCKAITIILCIFLVFEAHYLLALQESDVLSEQFEKAKEAYFAGDYESAKSILEDYVAQLETLEGSETLKGETYLLLGATCEAQKDKELAVKYYCLAKAFLGQGITIEGIQLQKQRWYWARCPRKVAAAAGKRIKRSTGALIGTLVGIGIFIGFFWYFFFSKKSPLKFPEKDDESDGDSDEEYVFTSQCFSSEWTFNLNAVFEGGAGQVTVTPWPFTGPIPNENNEWFGYASVQVFITEGLEFFESFELTAALKIGGGDGWTRRDEVRLNGDLVFDEENTFDNPCSNQEKIDLGVIFTITEEGTHDIELGTRFDK